MTTAPPETSIPSRMIGRREFLALAGGAILGAAICSRVSADNPVAEIDVCVYGATASGVMAAIAAAREGCRVFLVEPGRWLGGMTGGGLCHIDWGRPNAFGGTTAKVLKNGTTDPEYRKRFAELIKEHSIAVLYEHRVASVQRQGTTIRSIVVDHAPPDRFGCPAPAAKAAGAVTIAARLFIDCTYEGDLMAQAGVSCAYGRESADTYGESLAGVRPNLATYAIDPYNTPGDARSGLLPLLQDLTMGPVGSADRLTMGYGFRWKFSTAADRLPIDPPEHYDPHTFEIYRRGFKGHINMAVGRRMRKLGKYEPEGGQIYSMGAGNLARALWAPTVFGCNADYPTGDHATRSRIWKFHQDFLRGITHFLRTDPAVPPDQKAKADAIGFARGQFDETAGWPHQLYIREARRMKSACILTQKDLEGQTDPDDAVGLASYGVDDWPYATIPHEGGIALQGGEFSILYLSDKHNGVYKIPYRSITPKKDECDNLLVPVCVSASHIAMTSLRMEPVWMTLGESAGVAAAMAVRDKLTVQQVDYKRLRTRLLELGLKLEPSA